MDRRDFLKNAITGGIAAGCTLAFGSPGLLAATGGTAAAYDLVAVRGGEPAAMFDRAMASMGGMGVFVPKGARVLVKPNIGWDVSPDRAANTNPQLVGRIVEHCLQAGAREVTVFDHTCDTWARCYRNSGIERAVRDAGGKIVSGDSEGYYQRVAVPGGRRLTEAKVHELLLAADTFINVPVLKHHSSTTLTIGMKNMMGVVWDRGYWHRNDLHQCIADFMTFRRPTLTVVDAYNVMMQHGPRGVSAGDLAAMKSLVVSTDPVAADAAAAMLFGAAPADIGYIRLAAEMQLGRMDLSGLSIDRIRM
jgi:uncharacterized protein (DUF362 family)